MDASLNTQMDTLPLGPQFWYPLYDALLDANFLTGLGWPVRQKVYPIEDEA